MIKKLCIVILILVTLLYLIVFPAYKKYQIGVAMTKQHCCYLELYNFVVKNGNFPENKNVFMNHDFIVNITPEAFGEPDKVLIDQTCYGIAILTYGNGHTVMLKNEIIISEIPPSKSVEFGTDPFPSRSTLKSEN